MGGNSQYRKASIVFKDDIMFVFTFDCSWNKTIRNRKPY